jgi:hypothetical protein
MSSVVVEVGFAMYYMILNMSAGIVKDYVVEVLQNSYLNKRCHNFDGVIPRASSESRMKWY